MPPAQQPIITPVPPPIPPRKKSSRLAIGIAIGIGAIPGLLFIAYVLYLFTGIIYLIGHATLGPSFAGMQTNNLVSKVRQLPHVKSAVSKVGFGYNGFGFEAKLTIVGEDNTTNDQALEILKSSIPIFQSKFSNTKVIYKQSYAGGELAFISNSLSGIEKYQNDIPPTLTALRHELEGGMSNAWATSSYDDQHPAGSISCSSLTTSSSASKVKKCSFEQRSRTVPICLVYGTIMGINWTSKDSAAMILAGWHLTQSPLQCRSLKLPQYMRDPLRIKTRVDLSAILLYSLATNETLKKTG